LKIHKTRINKLEEVTNPKPVETKRFKNNRSFLYSNVNKLIK